MPPSFFVHEEVLQKLPYFEVRAARWQHCDAIEFHLPSSCRHTALSAIFYRLYAVDAHWTCAEWIKVLGTEISAAFGTFLLAKLFLADDLVPEVLAVIQQLASDEGSCAWLRRALEAVDLPELQGFSSASDLVLFEDGTLQQAALSAMKGSAESRELLEVMLSKRDCIGLAAGDAAALIAVLTDCEGYLVHRCTYSVHDVQSGHAPGLGVACTYSILACDFFKPFAIPAEGFNWLWQLVSDRVERQPELFGMALGAFQSMQWLQYEVSANRKGRESDAGSKRLVHVPEAECKRAIRRAFASLLMLGVRLLRRGHISAVALVEAFAAGTFSSAQAPVGFAGKRRNLLNFQQAGRRSATYVDGTDLIAHVFCGVGEGVAELLLGCVSDFRDWQWAFSPDAVRGLADKQQVACVRGCSTKWLKGETCRALRGEAKLAARHRLAGLLGGLDAAQLSFMRGGF